MINYTEEDLVVISLIYGNVKYTDHNGYLEVYYRLPEKLRAIWRARGSSLNYRDVCTPGFFDEFVSTIIRYHRFKDD